VKRLLPFLVVLPLCGLLLPAPARAEEPSRPERARSTFRLDYVLFDLEGGKRTNERTYSMTVNEGSQGQLRSGTRVPVAVDKGVQYMDVGLKISGRVTERDGDLVLDTEIERSSFALPEPAADAKGNPTLRTVSQTLSTRPAPGKPAILSTVDDFDGKKRLQVEVTVTRTK
jgi:hypothetical protein